MSRMQPVPKRELKTKILELLDENDVMTVATVRADGWPQATLVGYVRDDLTLYFAVARISQKLANIQRDPRVSIALGHHAPNRLRGLSMAAHAAEVTDSREIARLNALMRERYPGKSRFSPREISAALIRATPSVVSVIDLTEGPGEPELAEPDGDTMVRRIRNTALDQGARSDRVEGSLDGDGTVLVRYVNANSDVYRPGAPL
jgi:nitroimidazol reductase NimA-like FMN-containing flavoprotein (pyridoxamine 5'-phosphate oxidase superfamily)